MELMSTTTLPDERPAATPSASNSTASTWGVSGTITMMMSARLATSAPEVQTVAPPSIRPAGGFFWSCRYSLAPPACRLAAIGAPMMPRPIKPTFIPLVLMLVSSILLVDTMLGDPLQAIGRAVLRLVLAADPARVAQRVDLRQQVAVIDLARARLEAARIVGQLDVADLRQVGLDGVGQFALHALHVIDVVLDLDVVRARLGDDAQRLLGAIQIKAGDVEGVDRFDHETNLLSRQARGRKAQVFHHAGVGLVFRDRGRLDAHQAVQLPDAQRLGIGDGLAHAVLEFALARRVAGDAPLAPFPVAGGEIVQHQLQAVLVELLGDAACFEGVWEQEFHALEAGPGGFAEAVEEVHFVEQHGQIGCQFRHGVRLLI